MDFPLHIRRPSPDFPTAAICDRLGRVIAVVPTNCDIRDWIDCEAKQLVDAANASPSDRRPEHE